MIHDTNKLGNILRTVSRKKVAVPLDFVQMRVHLNGVLSTYIECAKKSYGPKPKGWGLSAKLGNHSAIWGKLGTALQAYTLNPCTKFPPNPTSRKVNT